MKTAAVVKRFGLRLKVCIYLEFNFHGVMDIDLFDQHKLVLVIQ